MRNRKNTLLAGVAALALFAGTGIALAQQSPQPEKDTPGTSEQSGMHAQPIKPNAGAQSGASTAVKPGNIPAAKTGGAAALNTKGPQAKEPAMAQKSAIKGDKTQKSAQEIDRNKMGAKTARKTTEPRHERLGANTHVKPDRSTAENEHGRSHVNMAQRNKRNLKGLQGNAAIPMEGSHVSLTPEQRTHVRDTVINVHGAPRVGHVGFDVRVGTMVPRRHVHAIPVPETLVQIDPGWRGFLYFIVRDEVVIVNPRDMRIVAILPA